MKKLKICNLFAGIGGNRRLWGNDYEITAVEIDPEIAAIYKDFYPNDTVIVGDAHQYLLDHYMEYDFIWSSPPCPTHSRFNFLNECQNKEIKYPDMMLYQEVILLQTYHKGKYCIENVISYYEPLIKPQISNNHFFWCNFYIPENKAESRGIRRGDKNTDGKTAIKNREKITGYNLSKYKKNDIFKKKILNNCTEPKIGLSILNAAYKNIQLKLLED